MDELKRVKAIFASKIEDGRKVEVFSSMPEWSWYVEHVLKPTIHERTQRIMRGLNKTEKEDWIDRGIVQGLQIVIDAAEGVKQSGKQAKKAAKEYQKSIKEMEDA